MALTTRQKAGWGLADMGVVTFVILKQLLILSFLATVLGIPVGIAGALTTAILLVDIVTDPIVGYMSDRTKSRWGRRVPWLALGAVVMAAGTVALFSAPPDAPQGTKLVWAAATFTVATVGFTMCAIPYSAMAGEITHDPKERSAMTGWRMVFASVGILVGGAIFPVLADRMGHANAALGAAALMILPIWVSIWMTRDAPRGETPSTASFRSVARLVLGNRAFRILVVIYGVMTFAVALITAGLPFAADYLIRDSGDTALSGVAQALNTLSLMFAAFVVGAIISQAFWVFASAKMGKLGALVLGLVLYIGLLFALFSQLPTTDVTWIALLLAIGGVTNGAYQQIPWAMYPDLMDITRRETGQEVEGAFSAVWLFGQKVANALAPGVLGLVLALFGWVETEAGVTVDQPANALNALHVSMTLVPAGILAMAIAMLLLLYRPRITLDRPPGALAE